MGNKAKSSSRLAAVLVGLGTSVLALSILVIVAYGFYAYTYSEEIFPNTTIASIAVGGLGREQAETNISNHVRIFEETPFELIVAETPVTVSLDDLSVSYDAAASVDSAYQIGRSNTPWFNVLDQIKAGYQTTEVPLSVSYDQEALVKFLDDLEKRFNDPAANAGFDYTKGKISVTSEQTGKEFDRAQVQETIKRAIKQATMPDPSLSFPLVQVYPSVLSVDAQQVLPVVQKMVENDLELSFEEEHFTVTPDQLTEWIELTAATKTNRTPVEGFMDSNSATQVDFNRNKIAAYAKTLGGEITQDPVDAKLTIVDGKATVFASSQDGRTLDEATTVQAILDTLSARRTNARAGKQVAEAAVKLPVKVTKPTVTSSTVADLGIQQLIGKASTDFKGSPDNRVHNISTGLKYLKGWLIKPGDEFSTVKALGAVDGSTGYLPELVIKENKTIPEFGGGLCQVSTTLFRTVMNAGLPITERKNHSYRVVYYERGIGPGLDATVYLPRPDFKFKNDTPGWVLIQGSIKGTELTFEMYGTDDGRTATIDGPHTLDTTPAPPTIYTSNDQMAPGEKKEVQHAHPGATTTATYTVKRGGEVINEQVFNSKYKAIAAQVQEGPKAEAPPAESTPAPETAPTTDQPAQP